jgi:hypothetical protein
MRKRAFAPHDLRLITPVDSLRAAIPAIGDYVRLKSGGPIGLVVDVDRDRITFARGLSEHTFPAVCLEICN